MGDVHALPNDPFLALHAQFHAKGHAKGHAKAQAKGRANCHG